MKRIRCPAVILFLLPLWCARLSGQPASSPWPMFRHDVRRTGRSDYGGPASPSIIWSYNVFSTGGSIALGASERLYVGSRWAPFVYALESGGQFAWSYWPGNFVTGEPAAASDGRIYFGSEDYRLYALKSDGTLSWSYAAGDYISSSPALGDSGRIYVGAGESGSSNDNNLYAFDSAGSLVWSYAAGGMISSAPALGSGERIYAGSFDDRLYALDSDGTLAWSYQTADNISAAPVLYLDFASNSETAIYIGSHDNTLYALSSVGALSWSYHTAGAAFGGITYDPALSSKHNIIAASCDNNLYVLDSAGLLLWSYASGSLSYEYGFAGPCVDASGSIYAGCDDNILYSFTPDGTLSWSYVTGGTVTVPTLGSEGRLYVNFDDMNVYCFGPTPPPTATPTATPTALPTGAPAPTATPTPNYIELTVRPGASGGHTFSPGDTLVLEWESHMDRYGCRDIPCAVYLGAARDPLGEDTVLTVDQIKSSGALFLFDRRFAASPFTPGKVFPTFTGVPFPVPGRGTSGTLSFTVPAGAAGRWVFATAFIRSDNGRFPHEPPVEVSNGFTLR